VGSEEGDWKMKPPLAAPNKTKSRLDLHVTEIARRLIDDFEWDTKRWRVRFQSWPRKTHEVDPLIDLLDVFPEDHPDYKQPRPSRPGRSFSSLDELAAWQISRKAEKQSRYGWHLRKVCDGVEGWFDLTKLPKEHSDKKPFVSFDLELNGTKHRCQFHVWEVPWPREKPTAWQSSTHASAGLPSLGKRR
jgi:hypothetical protein